MPDANDLHHVREQLAALLQRVSAIEQRLGMQQAEPAPIVAETAPRVEPPQQPPPRINATVESTIGAHWLNRIGIAAVLIGSAFFLKYAFDNNWIGPAMRVLIGVACGVALLLWAEVFHARRHTLFAHTIDVIGTGVLYLSIWAASQTYAIIANGSAFAAMIVVTIAVVALALRHRSEFLAGIALTGGFLTPLLLSTGVNREVELFAYVALLDVAALVLLALHPWVRALAVAFFGTLFLYVGWAASFYTRDQNDRTIAFATLFFLLFSVVPLLRRWSEPKLAATAVLLLPFANAFVYFTAQLAYMLHDQPRHLAWYAAMLAVFFFIIAGALHLRGLERDDLAAAHVALALGFITVAIPLRFDQLWITIGWLVESAALLVAARRLRPAHQRVFDILGSIALTLGVFRLLFLDHFHRFERPATYALAIAIFAGIAYVTQNVALRKFAIFALNFLAVTELTLEVTRPFPRSAVWMLYGAMLMIVGFRRRSSYVRWLALALLAITIAKVFFYDINELQRVYRILSFIGLGVVLLAISFAYQRKWLTIPEE